MSYGLTVWDAQGNVQMTTDDFTYQVLHSQVYSMSENGGVHVINVPGFDPATCSAAILPTEAASQSQMDSAINGLPYTSLAPGVITIYSKRPGSPSDAGYSLLKFRLLVMRFSN
ncbi:hypothetical protein [Pseudomonas donghuensis]|uniref:hypothetical protein n=1 Tax=Pseudomonas donghuensis TaxID=1163398 RepID=UPI00215EA1D4|nr:hypothetical protein [Pseudomonas donghuensis]UVL26839.1 hypothetical protein LOY30_12930 [Pseudomonas donghuensis]